MMQCTNTERLPWLASIIMSLSAHLIKLYVYLMAKQGVLNWSLRKLSSCRTDSKHWREGCFVYWGGIRLTNPTPGSSDHDKFSGLKWLLNSLQRSSARETDLRAPMAKVLDTAYFSYLHFLLLEWCERHWIFQLRKTWTPIRMWLIKGIPKCPFLFLAGWKLTQWLQPAHINQLVTTEIHYSVSYLCRQCQESALLLFQWCHFPLRGKVYLLSAGSHRNRTSAPGRRMFPSLGSKRHSDEVLKTSLTCLGSHFSSQ